jgi:hypothetical protein
MLLSVTFSLNLRDLKDVQSRQHSLDTSNAELLFTTLTSCRVRMPSVVEVLFTAKKQRANFDQKRQDSVKSPAYNMVTICQGINNEQISRIRRGSFPAFYQVS